MYFPIPPKISGFKRLPFFLIEKLIEAGVVLQYFIIKVIGNEGVPDTLHSTYVLVCIFLRTVQAKRKR